MSLVYRALWQDDRSTLHDRAAAAWGSWLHQRFPGLDTDAAEAHVVVGDTAVVHLASSASDDAVSVSSWTLREEVDGTRLATTTLHALTAADGQWLWVDVDHHDEERARRSAETALVRRLVDDAVSEGGDPRWGPVRLRSTPTVVHPERVQSQAVNLINAAARRTAVVVVAHDYLGGVEVTMDRARRAAARLVGVASVLVLPSAVAPVFSSLVGDELGIAAGQVRLYLPGHQPPHRQRLLEAEEVRRHPDEAGRRVARLLQPVLVAQRLPASYEHARRLLRRHAGQTRDELLELAEAELAERSAELEALRSAKEQVEAELIDALGEVEVLQEQLRRLRRLDAERRIAADAEAAAAASGPPDEVRSVSEAVAAARRHLTHVVIPPGVERDLDRVDAAVESRSWGQSAWDGLVALDAYARTASAFRGGFWEWCAGGTSVFCWPCSPKKLAMSESETVLSNERLRRCRMLPVDEAVDPSGLVLMQAHLKISEGGGPLAPRVYFHDDTKGRTGKVHVGFVGPHSHMPNTRTN